MADFDSVLADAHQLSTEDRLRLIGALWESVPAEADVALHPDWAGELERRVSEIEKGSPGGVSWAVIRDEAMGRIGRGDAR